MSVVSPSNHEASNRFLRCACHSACVPICSSTVKKYWLHALAWPINVYDQTPKKSLVVLERRERQRSGLSKILDSKQYRVEGLLTTVSRKYQRVTMHGIRRVLLAEQATNLDLPIFELFLAENSSMDAYASLMESFLTMQKRRGIEEMIFGDIFLEDLRDYRESTLAKLGLSAHFPLWKVDTHLLAKRFIKEGFRAKIACVDTEVMDGSFAGRDFDDSFLADLPKGIDPCGENGEFHTFVYDGPIFKSSIAHQDGETVLRENRFMFKDFF